MADITVLIQFWGPFESSGGNYTWYTADVLKNPETFDLNFLREKIIQTISKQEQKPTANMARLVFQREGKIYMKVTFTDLW